MAMVQFGQISAVRRGQTSVFRLSGEFDLSNAWEIAEALADAIRYGDSDIVVDLSEVSFLDAQLLRVLKKAQAAALRRELTLVVRPPADPTVGRVAALIEFDLAA